MVETSITDNMSTLTIDNIEPVNEGEYQCVVSNINGIASATVNVKIERGKCVYNVTISFSV